MFTKKCKKRNNFPILQGEGRIGENSLMNEFALMKISLHFAHDKPGSNLGIFGF